MPGASASSCSTMLSLAGLSISGHGPSGSPAHPHGAGMPPICTPTEGTCVSGLVEAMPQVTEGHSGGQAKSFIKLLPGLWAPEVRLEGGPWQSSASTHRNRTVASVLLCAAPLNTTGQGPPGSLGRGRRVGAGGWMQRGGAGRRASASLQGSSQVTDPAGPQPRPAAYSGGRAAASESSQRGARSLSRLCARGAEPPSSSNPLLPWPPRPPPAASWSCCKCSGSPSRRS